MDPQEAQVQEVPIETVDRKDLLAQQFDEAAKQADHKPEVQADSQRRAVDGKFLPKTADAAAPAEERPAEQPAEEPVWARPPSSWKRDYHEVWQTADPKLKEYAWQREEEMRRGIEPLLPKAQFGERMQKVIQPYEQIINGLGIQPEVAVEALMRADYTLRTANPQEKLAYFARLAQQYGINLGEIDPTTQPSVDPAFHQLQNQLLEVKGQVVGWQKQQEEQTAAKLQAQVEEFSKTAEHFEAVKPTMIQLLQSGVAEDLSDAYQKAIRLDDNLSSEIEKGRQAKIEADRRVAADKAAKAAKIAAVSVKSSTPGATTSTKAQDRRSLLSEQLDGLADRF